MDIQPRGTGNIAAAAAAAYLWCHPVGCSDERLPLAEGGRDLGRDAEVGQLDVTALRQQDVGALTASHITSLGHIQSHH